MIVGSYRHREDIDAAAAVCWRSLSTCDLRFLELPKHALRVCRKSGRRKNIKGLLVFLHAYEDLDEARAGIGRYFEGVERDRKLDKK